MPELVLVCGYPASGKSTLVKDKFGGHTHINRDTHKSSGNVADLLPIVSEHLTAGRSVVSDNLFATRESRKPFIELAAKHGVPCRIVVLDTSMEDAQVNVVCRLIKHFGYFPSDEEIKKSKHPNVFPPAVLYKFRKEYQDPKMDEGFDRVERHTFSRLPWPGQKRGLILDFDGTLRECPSGAKFPTNVSDISIKKGVVPVLKAFEKAGWVLLGASNQSGIAKGDLTKEVAEACFDKTCQLLGVHIPTLYCPHRVPPISCYCRKPGVGMVVTHIVQQGLDPAKSLFVGDMTTDKTCAGRVGMPYMHADEFFATGYKKFLS
jgi:D-glycero-D-manno-heptose 1,7-bisphosphate phosphatase